MLNIQQDFDVFIIGGGINGTGIAADASGRGLRVGLCEQYDLASGTSSASSKLIHGGLRYLEYYEFSLVRKALQEREVLLKNAPHLIHPLNFILPHHKGLRPAWLIRLGLFLYDHLAKREILPASKSVDLTMDPVGECLQDNLTKGFSYADCWVDDARLVIHNALVAKSHGSKIWTQTRCIHAERGVDDWLVTLQSNKNASVTQIRTKILVNAAGPWIDQVQSTCLQVPTQNHIKSVQGSHIIVPKLYEGSHAYILQHDDKRIVFAIPMEEHFTLIGTTDVTIHLSPEQAHVTTEEITYLCDLINHYFKKTLQPSDVIHSFCGVRPLLDDTHQDAKAVTRDYRLELEHSVAHAPLLSIFGGKITTYRILAEQAVEKLRLFFPNLAPAWTAQHVLPGGDMPEGFSVFFSHIQQQYPNLPDSLLSRYARQYGTRLHEVLQSKQNVSDLGEYFGGTLYQIEVDYLIAQEWAHDSSDILWRRTKQGLYCSNAERQKLHQYLKK